MFISLVTTGEECEYDPVFENIYLCGKVSLEDELFPLGGNSTFHSSMRGRSVGCLQPQVSSDVFKHLCW